MLNLHSVWYRYQTRSLIIGFCHFFWFIHSFDPLMQKERFNLFTSITGVCIETTFSIFVFCENILIGILMLVLNLESHFQYNRGKQNMIFCIWEFQIATTRALQSTKRLKLKLKLWWSTLKYIRHTHQFILI